MKKQLHNIDMAVLHSELQRSYIIFVLDHVIDISLFEQDAYSLAMVIFRGKWERCLTEYIFGIEVKAALDK